MREELDQKLYNDFPNLFADRFADMKNTCMCWGLECDDGWEPLIRELAEKLEPLCLLERNRMSQEEFEWHGGGPRAVQVKEKYGTLRFYMNTETEQMSEYIRKAEEKSAVTCEKCGKPGKLRGKFWLYTACDEHTKKEDEI